MESIEANACDFVSTALKKDTQGHGAQRRQLQKTDVTDQLGRCLLPMRQHLQGVWWGDATGCDGVLVRAEGLRGERKKLGRKELHLAQEVSMDSAYQTHLQSKLNLREYFLLNLFLQLVQCLRVVKLEQLS